MHPKAVNPDTNFIIGRQEPVNSKNNDLDDFSILFFLRKAADQNEHDLPTTNGLLLSIPSYPPLTGGTRAATWVELLKGDTKTYASFVPRLGKHTVGLPDNGSGLYRGGGYVAYLVIRNQENTKEGWEMLPENWEVDIETLREDAKLHSSKYVLDILLKDGRWKETTHQAMPRQE